MEKSSMINKKKLRLDILNIKLPPGPGLHKLKSLFLIRSFYITFVLPE